VVRAFEIVATSGQPFAVAARRSQPPGWPVIVVDIPLDQLDERIAVRTRRMFEGGILAEAQQALAAGARPDAAGLSAIGYPQAIAHLEGSLDLETAIDATATATRRLARRQRNWLRRLSVLLPAPRALPWNADPAACVSLAKQLVS
jgi:tRNA dimethylallyltransferase